MKSICTALTASMLAGGALLTGASALSLASPAAQDFVAVDPSSGTSQAESSAGGEQNGEHWHHRHGGMWHMYQQLELSREQKASMKAILSAARPQMKTLHEQLRNNEIKLMQATPGSAGYSSTVAEVAQSNATLASQRTSVDADLRAQVYAVLTPSQKTQLADLQSQWAARRQSRQGTDL